MLLAPGSDVLAVSVERDEDIEIVRATHRTYIQIKQRRESLGNAEVDDALERFEHSGICIEAGSEKAKLAL